jgi:serine/threonine-protein kinase
MGEVWAAVHTEMRREVALKLIYGDNPDLAVRLKREAQACGRLEHPNVVRIYDIGETDDGDPFLIMQLLTGETLADRLARRRRLPPVEALWIALDIARALRAAHAADIVHRDLKPANIYLHRGLDTEGEEVKVLDFGVSKILSVGDMAFTVTGALVGSPAYMSPEQARASKEIDPRADIWSLGVLLFEMLAGRRPFPSASPMGVIAEILAEPIPSLSTFVPGIDPRIELAVNLCMTREVDDRLQSAAAFIDMLRPVFASIELASTGAGGRMLPSLPELKALPVFGRDDPSTDSSGGEDLPTRMLERATLVRPNPLSPRVPPSPPSPPSQPVAAAPPRPPPSRPHEVAPPRQEVAPGWSRPVEPPRSVVWPSQTSSSAAVDTMMASSELMLSREAALAAATPVPPLPPQRTLPLPAPPIATDTVSTMPLLRLPNVPGLNDISAPLPLAWEPPPQRDRSKMALIGAMIVIVLSLITLLILMLTQDSAEPTGVAPGASGSSDAASVAVPTPPLPAPAPAPDPSTGPSEGPLAAPSADPLTGRLPGKRSGIVSFASTPSTHVLLDGKPMGSTPLAGVSVAAGSHRVTFIRATREIKTITINVKPDQRSTASVRFDRGAEFGSPPRRSAGCRGRAGPGLPDRECGRRQKAPRSGRAAGGSGERTRDGS